MEKLAGLSKLIEHTAVHMRQCVVTLDPVYQHLFCPSMEIYTWYSSESWKNQVENFSLMDAAFISKSKPCTEDVHMYIEKYGVTWSDTSQAISAARVR